MNERVSITWQRCQAMKDTEIENPESKEGIDFCVNSCPYEYCVVFESKGNTKHSQTLEAIRLAKALRAHGVSIKDIALILGKKKGTISLYLKDKKICYSHIQESTSGAHQENT